MYKIGRIQQVQIQQSSLKVGSPKRYDPTPLLVVEHLLVSASGVVGVTADGCHIIDVHNTQHPESRYRDGNGLSVGFTSHYDAMRARFGFHLSNGIAGENILVEADTKQTYAHLQYGLAIQQEATGEIVHLTNVEVADPCVQFSQYAARDQMPLTNEQTKEVLQFLHNGLRGFYVELANAQQEVSIQAGDVLFALEPAEKLHKNTVT